MGQDLVKEEEGESENRTLDVYALYESGLLSPEDLGRIMTEVTRAKVKDENVKAEEFPSDEDFKTPVFLNLGRLGRMKSLRMDELPVSKSTNSSPSPRRLSSILYYKGSLLAFGGLNIGDQYSNVKIPATNDLWEFRICENKWRKLVQNGTIPTPRIGHNVIIEGDTLFLFGGRLRWENYNDIYKCDLNTITWEKLDFKYKDNDDKKHSPVGLSGSIFFKYKHQYYLFSGYYRGSTRYFYRLTPTGGTFEVENLTDGFSGSNAEIECGSLLRRNRKGNVVFFMGEDRSNVVCHRLDLDTLHFTPYDVKDGEFRKYTMGFGGFPISDDLSIVIGGGRSYWRGDKLQYQNSMDVVCYDDGRKTVFYGASLRHPLFARAFFNVAQNTRNKNEWFVFAGRVPNDNTGSNTILKLTLMEPKLKKEYEWSTCLRHLYEDSKLTDCVIKCVNGEVKCHFCVISANSELRKMCVKRQMVEMPKHVGVETIRRYLDYLYGKKMEKIISKVFNSPSDLMGLYSMGVTLRDLDLCKKICEYCMANLTVHNCRELFLDVLEDENEMLPDENGLKYTLLDFVKRNLGIVKNEEPHFFSKMIQTSKVDMYKVDDLNFWHCKEFKLQENEEGRRINMNEHLEVYLKECDNWSVFLISSIDGEKIGAHKEILAASSEYYRTLFTLEHPAFVESSEDRNVLREECDSETLNEFVYWVYSRKMQTRLRDDVKGLVKLAIFANEKLVFELEQTCKCLILSQMSKKNWKDFETVCKPLITLFEDFEARFYETVEKLK